MEALFPSLTLVDLTLACSMALLAGLVKGIVGFAMPMVLLSALTSLFAPEVALAGLIVPTLVANGVQALRQGARAAVQSAVAFRIYMGVGGLVLVLSAQLVPVLPVHVMLLTIGALVVLFSLVQLSGVVLQLARRNPALEAAIGALAGFMGGLSGIWGPPTVMYLTALGTEKHEQVRIQGVIYGLGAVALAGAHLASGVLNRETLPLSVALVPPALLGMWLGGRILARIDQAQFRRATLLVLLIVGLNLVRRALWP